MRQHTSLILVTMSGFSADFYHLKLKIDKDEVKSKVTLIIQNRSISIVVCQCTSFFLILYIHLGMQNVSITNLVHILIGVNALHNITILKDEYLWDLKLNC